MITCHQCLAVLSLSFSHTHTHTHTRTHTQKQCVFFLNPLRIICKYVTQKYLQEKHLVFPQYQHIFSYSKSIKIRNDIGTVT